MPGGGVHPSMVPLLLKDMGRDFMVGAGGAVHGHPLGAAAGARALRQAIAASVQGISLAKAAQDLPELQAALNQWGIAESDVKGAYDLLQG